MNIRSRKKQLIFEKIRSNKKIDAGRRIVLFSVSAILLFRLILFFFELAYFSAKGISVSILSNVLLLPLMLILYMIYDGNKGIASIPAISAVIRIVVYFSSTHAQVSEAGGNLYTGLLIAVMVLQFATSVLVSAASKCQDYFTAMQGINLQIQKEFLNSSGRR